MTIAVEDKLAILELSAHYNHTLDYGDADGWLDTFSDDAVLNGMGAPLNGKDQLSEFAQDYVQNVKSMRHWTNNHIIEVDGDTASHTSFFLIIDIDGSTSIKVTGRYKDKLKKEGGEWKFTLREVSFD